MKFRDFPSFHPSNCIWDDEYIHRIRKCLMLRETKDLFFASKFSWQTHAGLHLQKFEFRCKIIQFLVASFFI